MIPSQPLAAHPRFVRHWLGGLAVALLCSACAQFGKEEAAKPVPQENQAAANAPAGGGNIDKAQQELAGGIASYENGAYKLAARQLQSALALGLTDPVSRARAHKYLAFMHCVGGRQRQCRDEFAKALDADPSFDLSPAEAGHPTWGPVFRKLKTTRKPTTK